MYSAVVLILFVASACNAANSFTRCPDVCECLGSMVDCSRSRLRSFPFDMPYWTEMLDLQNNDIRALIALDFPELPNLKQLDLSRNELSNIGGDVFEKMPNLTSLVIQRNRLQNIPDIAALTKLVTLNLRFNDIRSVERAQFRANTRLRDLDLSRNKITLGPGEVFAPGCPLKNLNLHNNNLSRISPLTFAELSDSLETLNLAKNNLRILVKQTFSNLRSLRSLDLSRNKLRYIEGLTFQNLGSVKKLNLERNHIVELTDGAFWGLSNLKELVLSFNRLDVVQKGFLYGLTALQMLLLNDNRIQEIMPDAWQFCTNLERLDLVNNQLHQLKAQYFVNLKNLRELALADNSLINVENGTFRPLANVRRLDISKNQLASWLEDSASPFSDLAHLEEVNVQANGLQSLTRHVFAVPASLKAVDVTGNHISTVHREAFAENIEILKMGSDVLICDCQLKWFPEFARSKNMYADMDNVTCGHPERLKGSRVADLSLAEFTCDDFPKPHITQHPTSQTGLLAGNLTLICVAASTSKRDIEIVWRKDDADLVDSERVHITTVVQAVDLTSQIEVTSTIHLSYLTYTGAGAYQCVARNFFGKAYSQRASIVIHELPTFTRRPNETVTAVVGSTARLECAASGVPEPKISWHKDGGDPNFPAAIERRIYVMPEDEVFFIVNVEAQDSGVYTCTASNDAGEIRVDVRLVVLEKPMLLKAMRNYTVQAGQTAVLQCAATGSRKPLMRWYHNGQEVATDDRRFLTGEGQLLVIAQSRRSDEGRYVCSNSKELDLSEEVAYLFVAGNSSHPVPRKNSDGPLDWIRLDPASTAGLVVIALVSCIVLTSVVWVCVIYRSRRLARLKAKQLKLDCEDERFVRAPIPVVRSNLGVQKYVECESLRRGGIPPAPKDTLHVTVNPRDALENLYVDRRHDVSRSSSPEADSLQRQTGGATESTSGSGDNHGYSGSSLDSNGKSLVTFKSKKCKR